MHSRTAEISARLRPAITADADRICDLARALRWSGSGLPDSGGFLIDINSRAEYLTFIRDQCPIVIADEPERGVVGFALGLVASYHHRRAPDWLDRLEWLEGGPGDIDEYVLIDQIAVARDHARCGLGAAMVREIARACPGRPMIAEVLSVPRVNRASQQLFSSHGFRECARRRADSLVWTLMVRAP